MSGHRHPLARCCARVLGAALLAGALSSAVALADPGPSLDMEIDPPEVTIQVCTNTTLTVDALNTGDPEQPGDDLHFVALTAVLSDASLMEFVPPCVIEARIIAEDGTVRWTGSLSGTPESGGLERFGDECAGVTIALPSEVILKAGERLLLDIAVHCLGEGDVVIHVFPRATEDHHDVAPDNLADVGDPCNLYDWPGGKKVEAGWYPLHNSLDPSDPSRPEGHSFKQHTWALSKSPDAFAKCEAVVRQETPGVTVESDCFTERSVEIPIGVRFVVGHKLKVRIDDSPVSFGPKVLPGSTYEVVVPFTVWSNDDVECSVTCTGFVGERTGIIAQPERMTVEMNGTPVSLGEWWTLTGPEGVTGNAGASCDMNLFLHASYLWEHDSYSGTLLLDVRQR